MNTYVIIGFDSSKFEIQYENTDIINISKIYCIGNEDVEENEVIKSITDKNLLTFYEEQNMENFEDKITFIDCRTDSKTYFDTMYSLNTCKFENRSYQIFNVKEKILNLKSFPFRENFNPWKGEILPKSLSENEKEYILNSYYNMVLMIKSFLKAEFHLKKITSIPDGWMMNMSNPVLQHISLYYGLSPNSIDVPKTLEFLHNSQYRQIITKTLIHICSNFLVNNKFINYFPENKSSADFWFKLENWSSVEF